MASQQELQRELDRIRGNGLGDMLARHARQNNFPVEYFFAIASRETNCVNELGDDPGDGSGSHGVGIVQIDIQHDIARQARDSGTWRTNPEPLIAFGAQMLSSNINQAKQHFPQFDERQVLKIAASGYNAGMSNAIAGAEEGDSDKRTTGHNYGADVMSRMAIFQQINH